MNRYTNPSGYVKYNTEEELCKELELHFLPYFFDKETNWKPILDITKEKWISQNGRIDYFGYKNNTPTYIEVKNWWITINDMKQIAKYDKTITKKQNHAKLIIICGGIEQDRELYLFNICKNLDKIILIKDIKEINPEEVVYWM